MSCVYQADLDHVEPNGEHVQRGDEGSTGDGGHAIDNGLLQLRANLLCHRGWLQMDKGQLDTHMGVRVCGCGGHKWAYVHHFAESANGRATKGVFLGRHVFDEGARHNDNVICGRDQLFDRQIDKAP